MGDIQIKDLEEITTAPASAFIPIDDGTVTKKISVANFNITGANSAYRSAQSAAANEAGSLSNKNASQEAQTGAVGAQTAAVAAQTAAETAQGYAEAAQTAAQGYATQAINAKDAAARYAAQVANAEAEASDSAERAETAEASARTYANTCSEMAADIASRTNAAESYATTATNKGKDAEAWADGQRDGVNVASTDPTYQNNAKYYAQQSATNASSASSSATAAESAKNTAEAKATLATNGATTANTRALDAEAWATGKRNNANVSNSDLSYNNNAKYYAQQASTNATNAAASQVAAESAKTAAINAKNSILASEANAASSASQAQTYAAQAEAATEKMPIVGSNGNWMVYDATEEQYVDSNKPSRGEVGATPVVTGSANVDSGVGTPSVTVVKTGTDAAPNFNFNFHNLKGAKGDPGNPGAAGKGIVSIVKTGTSGLTDTYTITYTDGTTSTFSVRNGADGSGGSGASYTAGNGINIADGAISVDTDSTPTANSSNPIASGWASNFSSSVAATYATKDEVKPYPDYCETEELSVLNKLKTFWNIENPVVIGFSTDQHINNTSLQIENNILPNLRTMADLTKKFPFNICVLGGDATATTSSIAALQADVAKVTECLDDAYCPVFHLVGNHDGKQNISTISGSAVFASHRTKPLREKYAVTTDESTNCYYDDASCNIRFIMLISQALNGYPKTSTQNFLTSALATMPNGYEAIIFSHHPLGNLTDNTSTRVNDWNEPLGWGDIVNPYAERIIACICGHVHADKYEIKNGILYLSTTCAGWYELNDGTTRSDKAGTPQCTAYDVFVVDRTNKLIHCVRYGIGQDRDISYSAISYTNAIPTSIDTNGNVYNGTGYKTGYRLNSSGAETASANAVTTGFIPVHGGDTIYLKNCYLTNASLGNTDAYICFYNISDFSKSLAHHPNEYANLEDVNKHINALTDGNDFITQFTVPALYKNSAYMRISCDGITANSIISINQPIDYVPEEVNYTNVLSTSIDTNGNVYNTVGYKSGYRLNSSGAEKSYSGCSVSGFIPVQAGDIVRLKDVPLIGQLAEGQSNQTTYIAFYKSDFTVAESKYSQLWKWDVNGVLDENGYYTQFTVPTTVTNNVVPVYMRISVAGILSANSVITLNEEIE